MLKVLISHSFPKIFLEDQRELFLLQHDEFVLVFCIVTAECHPKNIPSTRATYRDSCSLTGICLQIVDLQVKQSTLTLLMLKLKSSKNQEGWLKK